MATRRQRQRKLARAQFHSAQCKERNRSGRGFVQTYDEPLQERRSAVITEENPCNALMLDIMSRDELRAMAAKLNIRGRSIMTKAALINAIVEHHS